MASVRDIEHSDLPGMARLRKLARLCAELEAMSDEIERSGALRTIELTELLRHNRILLKTNEALVAGVKPVIKKIPRRSRTH